MAPFALQLMQGRREQVPGAGQGRERTKSG
jgi:hypothetical protein